MNETSQKRSMRCLVLVDTDQWTRVYPSADAVTYDALRCCCMYPHSHTKWLTIDSVLTV